MLLYNVTVTIDPAIADEWLEWMQQKHIPEVMATGCFTENRICRMLVPVPEADAGISFAFQYHCPDQDTLNRYFSEFAPALQKDHAERYNGRFAAFRSVLEIL